MNGHSEMASCSATLIIPCRNEEGYIGRLLDDLIAQQHPISDLEVLVMDGMSTDGTRAAVALRSARVPQIRLVDNPQHTVPYALNSGIGMASAPVVMILGAHSTYPPNYVSDLLKALHDTGADNVGGILETLPADDTPVSVAIAEAMSSRVGVGNAHFRTGADAPMETDTVPFGCYPKAVFDRIGLFDVTLTRNQDDELNGRLRKAGGRIVLIPSVRAGYYARSTFSQLWRMYRQYGLFKPLVNVRLGFPATLRQLVPPALVLAMLSLPITFLISKPLFGATALGLVLYAAMLFMAGQSAALHRHMPSLTLYFPIAVMCMHLSYGMGYLEGLVRFVLLRQQGGGDMRASR
jgi:glycosyltransferase involved in cell wall biosynthesis